MELKEYKFYINGTLLNTNPTGWNDLGIEFRRHEVYHSVWPFITDKGLKFYKDGYTILKPIIASSGYTARPTIEIKRLNKSNNTYFTLIDGVLDFSNYTDNKTEKYVEATIIQNGIINKISSREKIEINPLRATNDDGDTITIPGDVVQTISLLPIRIYFKSEFASKTWASGSMPGNTAYTVYLDSMPTINQMGDQLITPAIDETFYTNNTEFYISYTIRITFNNYRCTIVNSWVQGSAKYHCYFKIGGGLTRWKEKTINVGQNETDSFNDINEINISGIIDPGLSLTLSFYEELTNIYCIPSIDRSIISSNIFFTIESQDPETRTAEAYNVKKLLPIFTKQLFYGLSFQNNLFDSSDDYLMITSGMLLRGLKSADQPLTLMYRNLLTDILKLYGGGLWYNSDLQMVEISEYQDYYKDEVLGDVGVVYEYSERPSSDHIYNVIKAGNKNSVEYPYFNTNTEQNAPTEYGVNQIAFNKALELFTEANTDTFGIEIAKRQQVAGKDKLSDSLDTNKYFVDCHLVGSNITNKTIEEFSEVVGVEGVETRMNLQFTPGRVIWRNSQKITPSMYYSNDNLLFRNSQHNVPLTTTDNEYSVQLTENVNTAKTKLKEPLYLPIIAKFKAAISNELFAKLQSDPHGYLTFTVNGELKEGFIYSVKIDDFNKHADFEVLIKEPYGEYVDYDDAIFTDFDDATFI